MKLNVLKNNLNSKTKKKRLGRGIGSGKGKTCGRGVKGQKSRSGVSIKGFEGGQTSLIKRLPKRGFNPINKIKYSTISIGKIVHLIDAGLCNPENIITKDDLVRCGIINNNKILVKLLSCNKIKHLENKIFIKFDATSISAKNLVELYGGKIL